MSFAHLVTWRRLSLLAAGALEGAERERALAHVAGCERCALELRSLRGVLLEIERDPVRSAEPGLPIELLVRQTQGRIDQALAGRRVPRRGGLLWVPLAVAAALSAIVLAQHLARPVMEQAQTASGSTAAEPSRVGIDDEALRRLERRVAREQAVRYLSDAGDVLVTVAAAPQRCDRKRETLDLGQETRRSQELLQRRALLVDFESADVRAARPVLEDVERVLREVALLDACARPEQLLAIHDQLRERRLLMKIDLMTRELQG